MCLWTVYGIYGCELRSVQCLCGRKIKVSRSQHPCLAQWTRLVSAPAAVWDTSQPVRLCDSASASACARRRNDVTRCNGIDIPPYGRMRIANMKSSIKPEVFVHNVLHRRQRRTEPRPTTRGGMQKFEDQVQFRRLSSRTDGQTDALITILRHPCRGVVGL